MIKVSNGKKYADVLGNHHKEINTDVSGTAMVSARKTKKSDALILLIKRSNKETFTA